MPGLEDPEAEANSIAVLHPDAFRDLRLPNGLDSVVTVGYEPEDRFWDSAVLSKMKHCFYRVHGKKDVGV